MVQPEKIAEYPYYNVLLIMPPIFILKILITAAFHSSLKLSITIFLHLICLISLAATFL